MDLSIRGFLLFLLVYDLPISILIALILKLWQTKHYFKALIEKDGKVLIVFDPLYGLDFPGGKIQEGEIKNQDDLMLGNPLSSSST